MFRPFCGWVSDNPFFVHTYILKRRYSPNFKAVAIIIWPLYKYNYLKRSTPIPSSRGWVLKASSKYWRSISIRAKFQVCRLHSSCETIYIHSKFLTPISPSGGISENPFLVRFYNKVSYILGKFQYIVYFLKISNESIRKLWPYVSTLICQSVTCVRSPPPLYPYKVQSGTKILQFICNYMHVFGKNLQFVEKLAIIKKKMVGQLHVNLAPSVCHIDFKWYRNFVNFM